MRLLNYGEGSSDGDWAWYFRVVPARERQLQMIVCGSMLVPFTDGPAQRIESERSAGHRAAPVKVAGDLLVSGQAWPGGERETSSVRIGIAMGQWRKELVVFGDRIWEMGPIGLAATRPLPFRSMPVTYERAFGGPGYAWNPIGRGHGRGDRGVLLPNVERQDDLVQTPTATPHPAGFGPIDPYWRPRSDRLGSFGRDWLARQWPGLPDDFDPRHWNEAPADQQFAGGFQGDERITVFNMHPRHPQLDITLPSRRGRAYVAYTDGRFVELPLRLDTISIDMEAEYTELVWRAALPVLSPRLRDIAFLFTGAEDLGAPLPDEMWRDRYERLRRAEYPTGAEQAADDEPFETEEERAQDQKDLRADEAEMAALLADARRQAAEQGPPAARAADQDDMAAAIAALRDHDPAKADEIALTWAQAKGDEPEWTRERVAAAHAAGEAMEDAELSGLDLGDLRLDNARMAGATLTDACLVRTSLRGADLTGADLAGADATAADFTAARLGAATFRGTNVAGASFADADLAAAEMGGLTGSGVRFDGCKAADAAFDGAALDHASFARADLTGANFAGASLTGASFTGAVLSRANIGLALAADADFTGATMVNLRANGADLRGSRFTGARAAEAVFIQARLDGADLSRAVLTGAIFDEAVLDGAALDRAWLDGAKFEEASLCRARLTRCKLVLASFERADLTDADLSASNLYNAGLYAANCTRLRIDRCVLTGTLLAP